MASAKEICSPQDGRGGRAAVDGSLVRAVQRGALPHPYIKLWNHLFGNEDLCFKPQRERTGD